MQKRATDKSLIPGRTLHLLAFFCVTVLICGLLVTNFVTQRSLQKANVTRLQQNFEKSIANISYFFNERENDTIDMATSKQVTGFFSNRSLGMTMAYGLRSSLNNVTQLFKNRTASARMGEKNIYSGLALLDADGTLLSRWPVIGMDQYQLVPKDASAKAVTVVTEHFGSVVFIAPVLLDDKLEGYILAEVNYGTLTGYLLGENPGFLFITSHGKLVFKSQPETTIRTEALERFGRSGNEWPLELESNDFIEPSATSYVEKTPFTLFASAISQYNIKFYLAEKSSATSRQQSLILFMAVLAVLSIGVLLVAGTILRANTKNLVLKTSLAEAGKREKEVAEKIEELKLIIDGARLGTWNWNLQSGEVKVNERWFTMLGYQMGDLVPHIDTWMDLVHPDDLEIVSKTLHAHFKGRTPAYSVEHRLRHKSGKWIWVLDAGRVLKRDKSGKPLRALGIHLDLTEQKEAQLSLGKAKEESDAIIRNFLDTLIVVGKDMTINRVNQATCLLLGFAEDELLGKSIFMLFHDPEDQVQRIFSFYAAADTDSFANTEELRNIELCYRAKDGSSLQMSFNIRLLEDDKGEVTGVVAGAKDISSLKMAIDQIARQKEYIENLFDVAPEGLLAITPSMAIATSNRAFTEIIQTWATQFALAESDLIAELLGKLKRSLPRTRELVFSLTHNGVTAYWQYNATPIPSDQGIEYVVFLRDITDKRKAEAARHLLATVIEKTPDAVIVTEPDGVILYVNPAEEKTSGYDKYELLGEKASVLKSDQTNPATFQELWQTITKGNVWSGRIVSKKKDNTSTLEDVTISPVRNEEGDITNFVAIKRDVTEMDFLQRQLLQAKKMEAIGQLAAGIAHEINTPMQYVQNNVTFFERAFADISVLVGDYKKLQEEQQIELSREARQHLEDIDLDFLLEEIPESISETHGGINRVVKIVSAMKDFSHPGTEDKVAIDLNRALEITITVCRNEWKYVAEMETNFDSTLPMIHCLPDQLNQAVLNLIINCAHAIEETGASVSTCPGRISVSTSHDAEWVEIRVSDTGGGIPEEICGRVFDPFFTTKAVGKGTGQGLSIVHDVVVQKHGGTVDFISAPDQGTTFIVRLPIKITVKAEGKG